MTDRQGLRKTAREHDEADDFIAAAYERLASKQTDERKKVLVFTSPDSTTIIYACGWCKLTTPGNNREYAEACCRCVRCGNEKLRGRMVCGDCEVEEEQDRRLEKRAKTLALPIVEDDNGPVYVASSSGLYATNYFYDSADAAAEALYDDGLSPEDFAEAIVHPCIVSKLPVPTIQEWIEESWASEFDEYDYELSRAASETIAVCTAALESERPTIWHPRMNARIVLSCPENVDA